MSTRLLARIRDHTSSMHSDMDSSDDRSHSFIHFIHTFYFIHPIL